MSILIYSTISRELSRNIFWKLSNLFSKMPKKQVRNAFYFYMKDLEPALRREGRVFPNGMADVVPIAHPRWKVFLSHCLCVQHVQINENRSIYIFLEHICLIEKNSSFISNGLIYFYFYAIESSYLIFRQYLSLTRIEIYSTLRLGEN